MLSIVIIEFPSKSWNVGLVHKLQQKLQVTGLVHRRSGSRNKAAPTQLIKLTLLTNWCYPKWPGEK